MYTKVRVLCVPRFHTVHYKFLGFCRVQVQVVVMTPVCEMPDPVSVGCFIIVSYHSYYCGTASKFHSVVGSVNEGAVMREGGK